MSILIPTKDINVLIREYGIATLSDTTPPPPPGNVNINWQTDTLGHLSAYVSSTPVLNPKGPWSSVTTYSINDIVNFNGSSYLSIINNNLNNQPDTSPADWQILAQGGGNVTNGAATQLAFYQTNGTVVSPTQLTTDASKNNLTIPGIATMGLSVSANSRAGISDPTLGQPAIQQSLVQSNIFGAGWSLGPSGNAGWSTSFNENSVFRIAQRGIAQNRSGSFLKNAVGDTAGIYSYTRADGGATAEGDEGVTAGTFQSLENVGYFHGTVASTTGTGDIHPVLAFNSGNAWTTDGAFLLNISKGTVSGSLNGASSTLSLTLNSGSTSTFLNKLPVVGTPFTVSTAIGVVDATSLPIVPTPAVNAANPVTVTVVVNLASIGGIFKPFTAGSVVTVAGSNNPEQSIIQTASSVSGTKQQTLTLKLRNPNTQAIIFQGGIQGQYISFDANLALSGMRSSYYALGSLNGNDLIYALCIAGGVQPNNILPQIGSEAAQTTGARAGFHLYPGAEVVANNDLGFNCTLEQNGVAWAPGDVVENPHYPVYGGSALLVVRSQATPSNPSFGATGLQILMEGAGLGGPNTYGIRLVNNYVSPSNYISAGGPLLAPGGLGIMGPYNHNIYMSQAPDTGSVIFVQNPNTGGIANVSVIGVNYLVGGTMTVIPGAGPAGDCAWQIGHCVDTKVFSCQGVLGTSGTFTTADSKTVTVSGGIITSIV